MKFRLGCINFQGKLQRGGRGHLSSQKQIEESKMQQGGNHKQPVIKMTSTCIARGSRLSREEFKVMYLLGDTLDALQVVDRISAEIG